MHYYVSGYDPISVECFAAAGAALIHFFDFLFVKVVGWVLIPLAIGILGVGAQRYLRMRQRLAKLVDKAPTEDVP